MAFNFFFDLSEIIIYISFRFLIDLYTALCQITSMNNFNINSKCLFRLHIYLKLYIFLFILYFNITYTNFTNKINHNNNIQYNIHIIIINNI